MRGLTICSARFTANRSQPTGWDFLLTASCWLRIANPHDPSLAAAGFSAAALEAVDWARLQNIEAGPFLVLEAVVSGLALLAAGTIIKGDGQVKGLTTGVGLWLAGAIGSAAAP